MLGFGPYGCRRDDLFRLRARAFDRFEQTGRGPVAGRERDRRFGKRRSRVVGDHRRAHAGIERAVVKDDFRFADLNATAGSEMNRAFNSGAVVERAICRTEILEHVLVSLATHLSVHARRERIGNTQIVPSGTANGYAQPSERKMVGGAVGEFNY